MKKKQFIIICVLVASLFIPGLAFSGSQEKGDCPGFGFKHRHKGGGLMHLAEYEQRNLMVQTLSQMTGQSVETIEAKLNDQCMRSVIRELNIDRKALHNSLQAKVRERIKQAAANGTITPEQEKDILERVENRAQRRELMSQLIEKGIEDGTITQEQARMLMRKSR
jgi:polyhydroxyalkanoate synthesis regulator phasin